MSKTEILEIFKNEVGKNATRGGFYTKIFDKWLRKKIRKNPTIPYFTNPDKVYKVNPNDHTKGTFVNKTSLYTKKGDIRKKFKDKLKPIKLTKNIETKNITFDVKLKQLQNFKNFEAFRGELVNPKNKVISIKSLFDSILKNNNNNMLGKFVSLKFINTLAGGSRWISISADDMTDYYSFKNRIEEIKSGDSSGSGIIGNSEFKLDPSGFKVTSVAPLGFGDNQDMFYKTVGVNEKIVKGTIKKTVGDCGRKCLLNIGFKDEDLVYYSIPHIDRDCVCKFCGFQGEMKCVNKKSSKYFRNGSYRCEKCKNLNFYDDIIGEEVKPSFHKLENLIEFIREGEHKIDIVNNSISFDFSKMTVDRFNIEHISTPINQKAKTKRYKLCKVQKEDLRDNHYFYKTPNEVHSKHTIIYCSTTQHFDIIKNNKFELNDVYVSNSGNTFIKKEDNKYTDYKKVMNATRLYNTRPTIEYDLEYCFIDFETITNWDSNLGMEEYSLSVFYVNYEQSKNLEKNLQNGIIKPTVYVGYDCFEQFLKDFMKLEETNQNKVYKFITFNGANFDNFLFLNSGLKAIDNYDEQFNISEVFYNGTQLLNFKLNKRHHFFDVKKYLFGSLADNCKSFNVPKEYSKQSFDHHEVQKLYDDGKLDGLLKDKNSDFYKKLVDYNGYDCISLAFIYFKMVNALAEIDECKKYVLNHKNEPTGSNLNNTIGSLTYDIFKDNLGNKKLNLPKLSLEHYQDMQKYKVAGRVDTFYDDLKIEEKMMSLDVCSEYPYNMAVNSVWYPYGTDKDIIETGEDEYISPPNEKSKEDDDSKLAFYYCSFEQSLFKKNNLPNIYPKKEFQIKKKTGEETKTCLKNDWCYQGKLENYFISNVMIQLLKDNDIDVKIHKGIVFQKKIKSYKLFKPILNFMNGKNKQDNLKRIKSNEYNPAIREMLKLIMNSLSGKVIEGLHTEITKMVEDYDEFIKYKEKHGVPESVELHTNRIFTSFKLDEEDLINKQRPIYLAVLIYDYSKRLMWNVKKMIGLKNCVYEDTDAIKLREKHGSRLIAEKLSKMIVPHWEFVEQIEPRYKTHKLFDYDSKVFGSFENELEDNNLFIKVGKKSYLSCHTEGIKDYYKNPNKKHPYKPKMSFKGVNENAIVLEDEHINYLIDNDIIENNKGILSMKNHKQAYYYIHNNPELKLGKQHINFFDKLITDKIVFILTNNINKRIGADKVVSIDQTIEANKIRSICMIKKIQLSELEELNITCN